ncbi:unnamed protein product [Musa hybrid cultivar]
MTSPREWWRRAAAAAKDKGSLCMTRMASVRHHHHCPRRGGREVDATVIRATSHDERSVDYKSAGRVFAWARAAPTSFLDPLMWSLAHRAARTHSWAVALKSLLLAHGLLLCSEDAPPSARLGRLPFDLSDFRDRSSSSGFSAFIRAYFRFLDHRSLFSAHNKPVKDATLTTSPTAKPGDEEDTESDADLAELERLQTLLDLLLQVRPYADGMGVGLVLEAMDCVMIEILEIYSSICNGVAHFLVDILGHDSSKPVHNRRSEARRRRGEIGMRVLRRASGQSSQLSAYLDLCRTLGVISPAEIAAVQSIPDEDIADLEQLLLGGVPKEEQEEKELGRAESRSGTVITERWVVFDEEVEGHSGNPILGQRPERSRPSSSWVPTEDNGRAGVPLWNRNLIELI